MGRDGTGWISGYPSRLFNIIFVLSGYKEILKTNEELAEEVDKLYKSEDRILLERDKMLEEVESLRRETQSLRDENRKLLEEKQKENVVIEKLNQENLNNIATLVNTFALPLVV